MRLILCPIGAKKRRYATLLVAGYGLLVLQLAVSDSQEKRPSEAVERATASRVGETPFYPIYTWIGNTKAWDQRLHVSGYRMGCDSGDPQGCVREASDAARQEGLSSISLSMFEDPIRTLVDAREYSRSSASLPFLSEAGFDDFAARYAKLFSASKATPRLDPPTWLRAVVRNIKAENSKLLFGITIYEDELDSPYLRSPRMPVDVARGVERVHLFLHYRANVSHFEEDVQRAKALFPRAKVIAGLYAYDRVNYIPCAPSSARSCTANEELQLYSQAVSIDARLLKEGRIAGIEFYPGFFGKEAEWGGWHHRDYCFPERHAECIENTRIMRDRTVQILNSTLGW